MDTISLYYFTEAAKDLNFTQTANRLFLSQQNLSSHIARLESKCGCKLFQRKPKVQLTYEGELFLAYAKEAVAFALMADRCAMGMVNTLPGVTGAARAAVMGKLSLPPEGIRRTGV